MGNRSLRDEKQGVGRAGAPGRGSLFGKKPYPEKKPAIERARDAIAGASPGIKSRRQRIEEAIGD